MKTQETPGNLDSTRSKFEVGTPIHRSDRIVLVWLVFLGAVGLSTFEVLKPFLFPHLKIWEYEAMTICAGTFASFCAGYYITRKLERAVSMHAVCWFSLKWRGDVFR